MLCGSERSAFPPALRNSRRVSRPTASGSSVSPQLDTSSSVASSSAPARKSSSTRSHFVAASPLARAYDTTRFGATTSISTPPSFVDVPAPIARGARARRATNATHRAASASASDRRARGGARRDDTARDVTPSATV